MSGGRLGGRDLIGFALVALGGLAFLLSLVLSWQTVQAKPPPDGTTRDLTVVITDLTTWGTVYVLGMLILLSYFVAAVIRPAAGTRVFAGAWAVGMLISLGGATNTLTSLGERPSALDSVLILYAATTGAGGEPIYTVGPGLYLGFAAVVLVTAAVLVVRPAGAELRSVASGPSDTLTR